MFCFMVIIVIKGYVKLSIVISHIDITDVSSALFFLLDQFSLLKRVHFVTGLRNIQSAMTG